MTQNDPSPGTRLRTIRERKGFTRTALAGLAEVSENLLKSIELGRRNLTLQTALRLANPLGVTDLTEFYGDQVQLPIETKPSHSGLPEVRQALTSWSINYDGRPETPDFLRGQLNAAWQTWHTSPNQRTEIARVLPGLIDGAQRSARLAQRGEIRQQTLALLSHTYHLAQAYLAHHGERELVYLVVDRGMSTALDSEDRLAIGSAVFYAAHVLRQVGRPDEAIENLSDALSLVTSFTPDETGADPVEWLAMQADLLRCRAMTRGRKGDQGAWADWSKAAEVARQFPAGYVHPWTRVSESIIDVEGVMIAADLGDVEEVRRRASTINPALIPSTERRARHFIEVARASNMDGSPEATLHLLLQAMNVSAETVAYTPAARDMTDKLLRSSGATTRADVEGLARRLGLEPE